MLSSGQASERLTMAEKLCERCNSPYRPYRDWQRFCGSRCRRLAWEAKRGIRRGGQLLLVPTPDEATDAEIRDALRPYFRRAFGRGRFRMRY